MVLSSAARVLSDGQIGQTGAANRDILVVVTSTNTPDIGPSELIFPDSEVGFVSPGYGRVSFQVQGEGDAWWLDPAWVRLSTQVLSLPFRRVNLVAVALMPENGCQMDATTTRN